jgi:hypothetical protein
MMKGEATWKAPSAAAPFIRVRRSNFGLKIDVVMSFSSAGCCSYLSWREAESTGFVIPASMLRITPNDGTVRCARNDDLKSRCANCTEAAGAAPLRHAQAGH